MARKLSELNLGTESFPEFSKVFWVIGVVEVMNVKLDL